MRVTQTVFAAAIAVSGVIAEAQIGSISTGQSTSSPAQKNPLAAGQSPAASSSDQTSNNKVDTAIKVAPVVKAVIAQSQPTLPEPASQPAAQAAIKEPAIAAVKVAATEPEKKASTETSKTPVKAKVSEPTKEKANEPTKGKSKNSTKKGKSLIDKASGVGKLLFGKPERTKQRTNAKKGAEYIRKQKSAAEIKTDATGTKQPASLSDPNVNVMEAFSDLIKRYAGQKKPNKSQFREDITTVFESRAEKGDLTTKQYRQSYKMRKLKPNGVGKKRDVKTKRDVEGDLESREADSSEEFEVAAREAEASEELDIEAREAEPTADPEAMVYEEEAELVARKETVESDKPLPGSIEKADADEREWDYEDGRSSSSSSSSSSSKSKKKLSASQKAALKKKLAKKIAAKKKLLAQVKASKKKLGSSKKSSSSDGDSSGGIWDSDWEDDSPKNPGSGSKAAKATGIKEVAKMQAEHQKNLIKIAKLKAAIVTAQKKINDDRFRHDQEDGMYNYLRGAGYRGAYGSGLMARDTLYEDEGDYGYGYAY